MSRRHHSRLSADRQHATRELTALGFSVAQIAERLSLSEVTIESYINPELAAALVAHNAKLRAADKERRAKAKAAKVKAEALELQHWLAENTTEASSE